MVLPNFAVVDLETSGFSERRHRILQLGLVIISADGDVVDQWSTLVRLTWPLQRVGPTHVHGITRPMLRGAPHLDRALDELGQRIDGSIFTAHNAHFDGSFLAAATRHRQADDPLRRALGQRLCTLRLSRRLDPDRLLSHRLGDVCDRYGVVLDRPHDALADAAATAAILVHLLDAHDIHDVDALNPYYDRPRSAAPNWRRRVSALARLDAAQ